MGRHAGKKDSWFERGASAISRVSEGTVDGYVCPLCRRAFTEVNDLSFEHVPPAKLGGKALVLTCGPCNHTSGHTLDVAMRTAEDIHDWGLGTSKKPIPARLAVRDVTVNVVTERRDGGAFIIGGLPEQNDPAVSAAHLAALDAMVELPAAEQMFTVTFPALRYVRAQVEAGWLRAAYLAAFARFGYRYALRPLMDPIRSQIEDPTGTHLERFHLFGASSPPDRRVMRSITSPRSLRSLVVVIGRHLVFLPGFHADSDTLYERLGQRTLWPPPTRSLRSLQGPVYGWPTGPELALDFA